MPVWELTCPDCGHQFRSLVMAGARVPQVWVCSACGSRRAHPRAVLESDPFTSGHGGCGCGCG
jgi:transcription elongation factor Elf1